MEGAPLALSTLQRERPACPAVKDARPGTPSITSGERHAKRPSCIHASTAIVSCSGALASLMAHSSLAGRRKRCATTTVRPRPKSPCRA